MEQNRELYGGHTAPRAFEQQRNEEQSKIGYMEADLTTPNLRVKLNDNGTREVLLSYVDDIQGSPSTDRGKARLRADFDGIHRTFPLKEVSNAKFLRTEWDVENGQVRYFADKFIEDAAKKNGVLDLPKT